MEYRFFYPINQNTYNTKWKTRSGLENRIDIYFILPRTPNQSDDFHLEYGLKLRNQKKLELKVREKRFANGQEYWSKTIQSTQKTPVDKIDAIIDILNKHHEHQLAERVISSQPIVLCYVSKFRDQTVTAHGHKQEVTGLHLRFVRSDDQSQLGGDLYFETVCIEQSHSQSMDEKITEKLSEEHRNASMKPMGYPEFLFEQYQQIANEQKSSCDFRN